MNTSDMNRSEKQYELGYLGAGHMAEAIAKGAIQRGVLRPEQMVASDPNENRRSTFSALGIDTRRDNATVIRSAKQVMVAVKPQVMVAAATEIGCLGSDQQVILSHHGRDFHHPTGTGHRGSTYRGTATRDPNYAELAHPGGLWHGRGRSWDSRTSG